jgi:hypothetical protein
MAEFPARSARFLQERNWPDDSNGCIGLHLSEKSVGMPDHQRERNAID